MLHLPKAVTSTHTHTHTHPARSSPPADKPLFHTPNTSACKRSAFVFKRPAWPVDPDDMALEICPLKSAAMKLCDQTAECLLELKKSVEWQRISRSQYGYNFCNSRLSLPRWVKKSWICLRGAGVRLGMKRCLPVTSLLYGCREIHLSDHQALWWPVHS